MPVCLLYVHSSSGPPLFRHLQIFMYSLFGFSTRAAPMIKNPMINIRVFLQDHLTSFRMILLSFVFLILTGAVLLCLPFASKGGEGVPFLNALFTSTSAACVTGLVVYDTATKWTLFGKIVIIVLIQIGGLGVITIAAFIETNRRAGSGHRSDGHFHSHRKKNRSAPPDCHPGCCVRSPDRQYPDLYEIPYRRYILHRGSRRTLSAPFFCREVRSADGSGICRLSLGLGLL